MSTRQRRGRQTSSYIPDEATGGVTDRPRERLLERLPATIEPTEALRELHEKLAVATELYEHHGDSGRAGVNRAINDVVEYLSSQGIPRAALAPLTAVTGAIVDADRGTSSAIFKPDRTAKSGKPPASVERLHYEGHLAAVTECCVWYCKAQGMRPFVEPACRLAARMIGNSRWPGRYTAKELREIRERVQQSDALSPDRLALDNLLDSEVARRSPMLWANGILKHEWVIVPPA